jgi:ribosomal protein L11 methylase PrmA
MDSGLYESLVAHGRIVPHDVEPGQLEDGSLTIRPLEVPFVSYPYEWSFSQLQDAARLTLQIQRDALAHGMTLKDASAYNIQFHDGKPVLIDTLSFETRQEGSPWVAYRQFCQHFLAPLALMSRVDIKLSSLLRSHLDGIPLDLTARLLPWRSWLRPSLLLHIKAHARYQRRYSAPQGDRKRRGRTVSDRSAVALIESLDSAVRKLRWKPAKTEWRDYYEGDSYAPEAARHKSQLLAGYVQQISPGVVWDLGANNGAFSRIAAEHARLVVAFDIDPAAVEQNYRTAKAGDESRILPLVTDLTNPSPGLGWEHDERDSLASRGPADAILALALVHHLAISNNVPLPWIARFVSGLGEHAIVEWVPKGDPKVDLLLSGRPDIFPDYTQEGFEQAFSSCFRIVATDRIRGSERILYLLRRILPV